jgi:ACT domain-containing protein
MINLELINSQQKKLHISDEEMAKALGFKDRSTYYKYKTGSYAFRADMLPQLKVMLKIPYSNFFTKKSSKTEQKGVTA